MKPRLPKKKQRWILKQLILKSEKKEGKSILQKELKIKNRNEKKGN